MISALTIRSLRAADVGTLAGVLGRAYASDQNFKLRLETYLRTAAVATFVADIDGRPVGMVVGNDYGPIAYVAQMAVDPLVQRHGIGRALMDSLIAWADQRGFAAVELDATPAGEPLYRRYGFVDTGRTVVSAATTHPTIPREAVARVISKHAPRRFSAADRDGLFALDARAFGADRSDVLRLLIESSQATVLVVAGASGVIDGYAVAQHRAGLLGPVVATNATIARRLIDAARAELRLAHRINVPAETPALAAMLADRAYRFERSLAHMVRGALPRARREMLFARINLGQG